MPRLEEALKQPELVSISRRWVLSSARKQLCQLFFPDGSSLSALTLARRFKEKNMESLAKVMRALGYSSIDIMLQSAEFSDLFKVCCCETDSRWVLKYQLIRPVQGSFDGDRIMSTEFGFQSKIPMEDTSKMDYKCPLGDLLGENSIDFDLFAKSAAFFTHASSLGKNTDNKESSFSACDKAGRLISGLFESTSTSTFDTKQELKPLILIGDCNYSSCMKQQFGEIDLVNTFCLSTSTQNELVECKDELGTDPFDLSALSSQLEEQRNEQTFLSEDFQAIFRQQVEETAATISFLVISLEPLKLENLSTSLKDVYGKEFSPTKMLEPSWTSFVNKYCCDVGMEVGGDEENTLVWRNKAMAEEFKEFCAKSGSKGIFH